MSQKDTPFFVGYLPLPKALRGFTFVVSCLVFVIFFGAGLLIGGTQDAPEDARLTGRQTVTGVLELTPYPILRVTEGSQRIAAGKTLMLSSGGKRGALHRAGDLDGAFVQVSGAALQRGTIDMIQLRGGRNGLQPADGDAPAQEAEPLGRWKLAGEICDGKCLYGAMRPGRGLAHKACANLCLTGDIPPVFVSSQPVKGHAFMMVVGPEGTLLPQEAYDYVGQYISVEAELERRGDILIMEIDPATLEVLGS